MPGDPRRPGHRLRGGHGCGAGGGVEPRGGCAFAARGSRGPGLPPPGADAPHGGQPLLGPRSHARAERTPGRRSRRQRRLAAARPDRGGAADPRRGSRGLSRAGTGRRLADRGRGAHSHALQRGGAGHRWLRHCARRGASRRGGRVPGERSGRRDASAAAGCPPDGLGAAARWHSGHGLHRRHGGLPDAAR